MADEELACRLPRAQEVISSKDAVIQRVETRCAAGLERFLEADSKRQTQARFIAEQKTIIAGRPNLLAPAAACCLC